MRFKSYYWILVFVGLVMGIILTMQFRVTQEITKSSPSLERTMALSQELEENRKDREKLKLQVYELRDRLDQAVTVPELGKLKEELDRVRGLAGMTDINGPGVKVTLNDSPNVPQPGQDPNIFVLHDEDLLILLNELKAAGANAIAINEHRIISTTEVRCIGPTILINKNQRISPPFIISALGNPDTLANSLKMKSGVLDLLQVYGIQADVKKMNEVTIPAYSGTLAFNHAKPKQ